MSTILDALRKVEEDARAHSTDVRTRLLLFPNRFDLRPPRQRRTPWLVGTGLMLAGFAIGIGLMLWGLQLRAPKEEQQVSSAESGSVSVPDKKLPPLTDPTDKSKSLAEPIVAARVQQPPIQPLAPAATPALSPVTAIPPPFIPPDPRPTTAASASSLLPAPTTSFSQLPLDIVSPEFSFQSSADAVQRSPFITTPPVEKTVAAAPKPVPTPAAPPPSKVTPQVSPPPESSVPPPAVPAVKSSPAPTDASLSMLQWSPDPEKRLAFIKFSGRPMILAHEGDTIEGYTVVEIRQDTVELRSGEKSMTLRAR